MAAFMSAPISGGDSSAEFTVVSPCGAAGGAMYDGVPKISGGPPWIAISKVLEPHCFLDYAPPVIIGDTYMSMCEGFRHVNTVFRVNGDQPAVPNAPSLNAPLG